MTSAPAIGFEYRPSRRLAQLCAAVGVLALAAVALCGLDLAARIGLALLVVAAVGWTIRRVRRSDVLAVGLSQEGGWSLRRADGSDTLAALRSSRVIGGFVLLQLAVDGARHQTLLLGPDNTDADIRRRLRTRLAAIRSAGTTAEP